MAVMAGIRDVLARLFILGVVVLAALVVAYHDVTYSQWNRIYWEETLAAFAGALIILAFLLAVAALLVWAVQRWGGYKTENGKASSR